ncbi:MAG TPA: hypothetical protein PLW50_00165 [Smithellaceae bacterium]|nr:hypothetical protein [Smithellaceae bacterium]
MFKRVASRFLQTVMSRKPLKYELINVLDDLARFYCPSGHAENIIDYSFVALTKAGFSVSIDAMQNVIASRGKTSETDTLVCINAHTDTVQKASDEIIGNVVFYDWVRDTFHTNGRAMIGGDDKCGIAVGLTLALYTDLPMKIIFTSEEEVGSIGAEALDPKELDDVAFTITIDRMGGKDLISNYCGLTLAPDAFVKKFIEISKPMGVEFEDTNGTYADTYVLAKYKPAVNLSSGYYNPHTSKDFIYVEELYRVMLSVKNAIENKQVLEEAIASAPKDWQKREYAAYRGDYYGGGYSKYYSFGNKGHYVSDTWLSRKQKRTMQKCKIKYGSEYGNGKKHKLPKADPDRVESADELIESYAEGAIYDEEWDAMLAEGMLTKQEYHIGIDEKLARESYAETFESSQMDARSRWEEEEEGFDIEEEEDEERKISVMRAFQNESDAGRDTTFGHDELEELGIRSGYLKYTLEDEIFVDYVTNLMTYQELVQLFNTSQIERWFFDQCIKGRNTFVMYQSQDEQPYTIDSRLTERSRIEDERFKSKREHLASYGMVSGYEYGMLEDDVFTDFVSGSMPEFELWENVKDGLSPDTARKFMKMRAAYIKARIKEVEEKQFLETQRNKTVEAVKKSLKNKKKIPIVYEDEESECGN